MRGLSQKTEKLIAFAHTLLAEHHPMTLRQLHYAIFSAPKIAYDNTQADYKRLSRATTLARRAHRWGELQQAHLVSNDLLIGVHSDISSQRPSASLPENVRSSRD
jgi:hypothetical protein